MPTGDSDRIYEIDLFIAYKHWIGGPISQCGLTSSLSASSPGLASSISKVLEEAHHNEVKYCDFRIVRLAAYIFLLQTGN